jgi:Sec7-like guanine-nucleotide exchange factor
MVHARKKEKNRTMENQENKSIPEKILEDFYETLKEKEDFGESLIDKLKILGKIDKLSNQKSVEELITPKKEPDENTGTRN